MAVVSPATSGALRSVGGNASAVGAIDRTFSAPKSVSAVWALASPELHWSVGFLVASYDERQRRPLSCREDLAAPTDAAGCPPTPLGRPAAGEMMTPAHQRGLLRWFDI
jgi:hypothetical protein